MSVIIFQSNVFQMSCETGLQLLERKEILEGFYKSEQLQTIVLVCDIVINWLNWTVNWVIMYFPSWVY